MKNISAIISAIVIIITLFNGCSKPPNHSIRITNSYPDVITEAKLGSTSYGRIEMGATTDYKPRDEGDFTVEGSTANGLTLTGKGKVNGKGTHKWTMTITAVGECTLAEDK